MIINVGLPVDKDGGVRRRCPLCIREFKAILSKAELEDFTEKSLKSFLLQESDDADTEQEELLQEEHTCPYCGQQASADNWWTHEQEGLFMDIARNIAMEETQKSFKQLERTMPGRFKAEKVKLKEPRILTEPDDMNVFNLPCCDRKIKIEEDRSDTVYCFFCGFPHKISD